MTVPQHSAAVVDWKKVKATLGAALAVVAFLAAGGGWVLGGPKAALVTEFSILCLALGFWITEKLVGVFTQTVRANPTAILLLFSGKLGWWATLFWAARRLPPGYDKAVGLGIGAFLLALLLAMLRHYGMPRISDGNPPPAP